MHGAVARITLVQQLVAALKERLEAGAWPRSLPSEKDLAGSFGVSRTTVRAALSVLRSSGLVNTRNGVGSLPQNRPPRARVRKANSIGLIEPVALRAMLPYQMSWIDEVRARLAREGIHLVVHPCPGLFTRNSAGSLARLVSTHSHLSWLLNPGNTLAQDWFHRHGHPCLVAGKCHAEATLPSVTIDHAALGVHAAGRLLGAGHRRIAVYLLQGSTEGWQECVAGFKGAIARSAPDARVETVLHPADPQAACAVLRACLRRPDAPTALFVVNPSYYITALGYFASAGIRVPLDMSLITTFGDPFLAYAAPPACRYDYRSQQYGETVFRALMNITNGNCDPATISRRIVPAYLPGKSIAPPRTRELPFP